jgi:hypothetical protein
MAEIPQWHVAGDWFDVCSCDIACPCIFGQPPTNNVCYGVLAYRIREGYFGDVTLADLKLVLVISFEGNLWASQATDFKVGLCVDSSANSRQRRRCKWCLAVSGGTPAPPLGDLGSARGARMKLSDRFRGGQCDRLWRAEVPGKVSARAEALTGPMTRLASGCNC